MPKITNILNYLWPFGRSGSQSTDNGTEKPEDTSASSPFPPPRNPNYAATVVSLSTLIDLPNCDNVKAALVYGNSVIVGKDEQVGNVGLYFPVETALSKEFLSNNNLFRKEFVKVDKFGTVIETLSNVDPEKKGYFEDHGRIKAVKFRGHKSEGFWIPINSLSYLNIDLNSLPVGTTFDVIDGHEICRKYIPQGNRKGIQRLKQGRVARLEDKLVDNQFRFHIDTEKFERNLFKLYPEQVISISDKWHGTSTVASHLLIKRDLNLIERILKFLRVQIQELKYGYVWSSRRVVKGVDGEAKQNAVHYYSSDIYGTVAKEIEAALPKGYSVYGEVVGYLPVEVDGQTPSPIQSGLNPKGQRVPYHYGCAPGTHRLVVYRVTVTNEDGKVLELGWNQMKQFCAKMGLETVKELYYGLASNFAPDNDNLQYFLQCYQSGDFRALDDWRQEFFEEVKRRYVHDQMCPYNNMDLPAEGVVIKIDRLDEAESYKVKSFAFLQNESKLLDKGDVDLETQESQAEEEDFEVV